MDGKTKGQKKVKRSQACKVCGEPLPPSHAPHQAPFCSERCRLNDLSKWFGENYRIASEPAASGDQQLGDEVEGEEEHK